MGWPARKAIRKASRLRRGYRAHDAFGRDTFIKEVGPRGYRPPQEAQQSACQAPGSGAQRKSLHQLKLSVLVQAFLLGKRYKVREESFQTLEEGAAAFLNRLARVVEAAGEGRCISVGSPSHGARL